MMNIYSQLANSMDISLVGFSYSQSQTSTIQFRESFRQIVVRPTPEQLAYDLSLSSALNGVPATDIAAIYIDRRVPDFGGALQKALAGADIAVAEHPYCFHSLRSRWRGPTIYSAYNVEAQLKASMFPANSAGAGALKKVEMLESLCCRMSNLVFTVSEEDKEEMSRRYAIPKDKIIVAPNGANLPPKPVLDHVSRRNLALSLGLTGMTAIFVGSGHPPNLDGALATIEVARKTPDWRFLIIGGVCNSSVLRKVLIPQNVSLLGDISRSELLTIMAAADVGLNPITSGGGTSLKILDYAASGLLIVSTDFGNRGFAFVDGKECLISPVEDIHEILGRVTTMPAPYREILARGGFERVKRQYTWKDIVETTILPGIISLAPEKRK